MKATANPAEQSRRAMKGVAGLVERITPWLVEVGSWILGGLIALNLVIIAALVTVGPADPAIRIAVTAFACALPLDVVGIVLLRLIKDWQDFRIDELTLQAFQEAHFPDIAAYFPPARERESLARRRARIALAYALGIAAASVALTLVGMAAALWHMAPWIAETFAATIALSAILLIVVIAHALPPETAAEKALKRRYWQQRTEERLERRRKGDRP
jgi:hypothetical protein